MFSDMRDFKEGDIYPGQHCIMLSIYYSVILFEKADDLDVTDTL